MATNVLRLLTVPEGREVGRLVLQPDGSVVAEAAGPTGDSEIAERARRTVASSIEAILRARMREFDETEAEAFAGLATDGWFNSRLTIARDV